MKRKQAFSLVELLIVIGIIAILAGVMLTQFSSSTDSALSAACMNNMRTLCNAVLADASKQGYYPAAGAYQYYDEVTAEKKWFQGWIGRSDGNAKVSCYHDFNDDGEAQHYALTNGTIWKAIGGRQGAYICPAHMEYCKDNARPLPSWSYVMNSYFGWDLSTAADIATGGRRSFGEYLNFKYSSSPKTRSRPPEKVLLLAEIPFVENDFQQNPDFSTSASEENDAILKYATEGDLEQRANKAADGDGETIGFNHRTGNNYSAHVAFADGHCVKLMLPKDANGDNLRELTSWLCTGLEYTFNGRTYRKVSE